MADGYESRSHCRLTDESPYWTKTRDPDAYPDAKAAMKSGVGDYSSASPRSPPWYGSDQGCRCRTRWPPSPSVEDETRSLARELPSAAGHAAGPGDGEAAWRGTVDQIPIIQDLDQPANDDRRFVLVSAPRHQPEEPVDVDTDAADPPLLFAKRTSTPYAYTNPPRGHHASTKTLPKPPRRPLSPCASRPSPTAPPPSPPLPSPVSSAHPPRLSVAEPDRHATYPPLSERPPPVLRPARYETMPVPMPQINLKDPSPPPKQYTSQLPLPYPADDRPVDAYMPPEERYQHDHSYETYTPISPSPRLHRFEPPLRPLDHEYQAAFRPRPSGRQNATDERPHLSRIRSDSVRSPSNHEDHRGHHETNVPLSLDRPLPSCLRIEPSFKYKDWYTLQGCSTLDVCPSCYDAVFGSTPFAGCFSQTRRHERLVERFCDFGSSPWIRLAWMLTIKQRRESLELLYNLAEIMDRERSCPGDRKLGIDHVVWYGISDPRDGAHVNNFAICPCDLAMAEELFPSIRGRFTRLPATTSVYTAPSTYVCSFRIKSTRFPKYLGLLVELDAEAHALKQHPRISRFVQLARENAFKTECQRERALLHKAWHFIPTLPEFTVCQECFEEFIWPHLVHSPTHAFPSTVPRLFNRTIQPVPGEDPELGSSCCLYSPRMRQIWERAVRDEDFGLLKRKAIERKRAEARIGRERRDILGWMDGLARGTREWEEAKVELQENEEEWKMWK